MVHAMLVGLPEVQVPSESDKGGLTTQYVIDVLHVVVAARCSQLLCYGLTLVISLVVAVFACYAYGSVDHFHTNVFSHVSVYLR